MATFPDRFLVLDTETTGLSPREGHRMVEFSVAEVDRGVVVGIWSVLINPERSNDAIGVNGIADSVLAQADRFEDVVDEVLAWIGLGLPIVAHNASFDRSFVKAEIARVDAALSSMTGVDWICSKQAAQRLLPQLSSHSLQSLAGHLGVQVDCAHRAEHDVRTLAAVVGKLREIEAAAELGQQAKTVDGQIIVPQTDGLSLVDRATAALEPLVARFAAYRAKADSLTCDSDEDDERVSKAILAFKELQKSAEDVRGTFTAELRQQVKTIETAWRSRLLSQIEAVVASLVKLREPRALAKAKEAAEARKRAEAEAVQVAQAEFDRVLAETPNDFDRANTHAEAVHDVLVDRAAAIAPAPTRTALGTVKDEIVYSVEIIDRKAVPLVYWSPDVDLIREAVTKANGELAIPGVLVTSGLKTSTRRKAR